MRILFIGTVKFSFNTFEKLISLDADIVGLCTKQKSDFNSDFSDLTPLCNTNNIPYKFVEDINSIENIEWIKSLAPDIVFCFGWSSLIKKELLTLAPMGVVGYHPTALPKNRGRHPLIWVLALGLKESASTFFFMEEGADNGDILSQKNFEILYEDDAKSIYNKVIALSLIQIEAFLPKLKNKTFIRRKQDHNLANVWRKRGIKDGVIDFRMNSNSIYNLVRALTRPYVGAHINHNGINVSIWKVEEIKLNKPNIECGKVLESDNNTIVIKTYDSAIRILEHDFETLPKIGEYL